MITLKLDHITIGELMHALQQNQTSKCWYLTTNPDGEQILSGYELGIQIREIVTTEAPE